MCNQNKGNHEYFEKNYFNATLPPVFLPPLLSFQFYLKNHVQKYTFPSIFPAQQTNIEYPYDRTFQVAFRSGPFEILI